MVKSVYESIVKILMDKCKTISTMESCTGGGVANMITNVSGSSEVFNFGAVTYSNAYKVKMGVDKSVIDNYSVYSIQTANEMSKAISNFTGSDYGIGVTGKLKKADTNNMQGEDDLVFVSVFDKNANKFYEKTIKVIYDLREENKAFVIENIGQMLLDILK